MSSTFLGEKGTTTTMTTNEVSVFVALTVAGSGMSHPRVYLLGMNIILNWFFFFFKETAYTGEVLKTE